MDNNVLFGSIIFLIGALFGFGISSMGAGAIDPAEIQIIDASFSTGSSNVGTENSADHQRYSYNINMLMDGTTGRSINSVQVIFTDSFSEIVILNKSNFTVNSSNNSDLIIHLDGEAQFNATGLSKKDILDMDPCISHIVISSEESVQMC